ncbi:helix-turn-helix transcriptional regulator [Tepidibacillus marianensis]|uniref:helix-turn-helix transcriptional regulator n=1 Tax=Tepidibacillus marianensis TaxID=3131995 RepID=UPI0030D1DD3F
MAHYPVKKAVIIIELSNRQETILKIVKEEGPITGEQIAEKLNLTRATLRPDLSILTMAGYLDARPRVGYFYSGKKGNQILKESLSKMLIKDFKAVPVVIKEETSVYDAIVTMFLEDVGTLYVVKDRGTLAGIVSRKDLLKAAIGKQSLQELPISVIMTRMPNIITCKMDDSLIDAANKLIQYQIDSLPVVKPLEDGQGMEVVGRVTKTTIAKAFVELGKDHEV